MIKKTLCYCLLSAILCLQLACDDKDLGKGKCFYEVKYSMDYCPVTGAALVYFTAKNRDAMAITNGNEPVVYSAALLNVPERFRVRDKVFYITYHPAKSDEVVYHNGICPAIFGPTKFLIVDTIAETDCTK